MNYFELQMNPIAWQRARRKGKRYFDEQLDQKTALRWHIKSLAGSVCAAATALKVVVQCEFPMPASWSLRKRENMRGKPHTQVPDADNLFKFIGDTFNKVLWEDDKFIYEATIRKVWEEEGKVKIFLDPYEQQELSSLFEMEK